MESSGTSQSQLSKEESSKSKEHAENNDRSSPKSVDNPTEEVPQELNSEDSYFTQNPYMQQYYIQYMHPYVLDRGLAAMNSEMRYIGRKVQKLANDMKECTDTMCYYMSRMLSLQRETLDKTKNSLESAVHLLREIKATQEQRPLRYSSATRNAEQDQMSETSDGANIRHKEGEHRHRSRYDDCSTQHRKRFKEN